MTVKNITLAELRAEDEAVVEATKAAMVAGRPYDGRAFLESCVRLKINADSVFAEVEERKRYAADLAEWNRINDPRLFAETKERILALRSQIEAVLKAHKEELEPLQAELQLATNKLAQLNTDRSAASTRLAHARKGLLPSELRAQQAAHDARMADPSYKIELGSGQSR